MFRGPMLEIEFLIMIPRSQIRVSKTDANLGVYPYYRKEHFY